MTFPKLENEVCGNSMESASLQGPGSLRFLPPEFCTMEGRDRLVYVFFFPRCVWGGYDLELSLMF